MMEYLAIHPRPRTGIIQRIIFGSCFLTSWNRTIAASSQQRISPDKGVDAGHKGQQGRGAEESPIQVLRLRQVEIGISLEAIIGGCKKVDN